MARPRKNVGAPDARAALLASFWDLLEDHQLHEVSVGMIASHAGYNRGTFYYYFADKDALVTAAVEEELSGVPRKAFALVSGLATESTLASIVDEHVARIALFMEKGGRGTVEKKVKDYLFGMWTALLAPEGGELTPQARFILEYMSSGALGLMASFAQLDDVSEVDFPMEFLQEYSELALRQICEVQGIDRDEVLTRLRVVDQLTKVDQG